jgi:ribose transport system ATP-binding protein
MSASANAAAARPASGEATASLKLVGIKKSFGAVQALKGVDLSILPGEVHAVVGENGAGKSTLLGIAAGVLVANAGEVISHGELIVYASPREMRERGVAVAFQHPTVADDLTVLENLQLAAPGLAGPGGAAEATKLIERVAIPQLRPNLKSRVGDLTLAQRYVVEIARALAIKPRVLFLDEPTAPFQEEQVQRLFQLIRELAASGVAIVYVSHRLQEVMDLADRMSVLRDGELVATRTRGQFTVQEIVTLIAGRPLAQMFPHKAAKAPSGEPLLSVKNLSGARFHEVSFEARAGEIVGITGIEGQGQRPFVRALAGLGQGHTGEVRVGGKPAAGGPATMRAAGIGFISDDRHAEGLFLPWTIRENIGFGVLARLTKGGVVDRREEAVFARNVAERLSVKARSIETPISSLSGGNQQKVLFGREASAGPTVLLIDEPTKGVDVGARSEIYQQLRDLADQGMAIVVLSSDGVELEGLCDRVVIFAGGRLVRELKGEDVTDTVITEANMTALASRGAAAGPVRQIPWARRFLSSDQFPGLVLVVLVAAVLFGTSLFNSFFVSAFSIAGMLTLLSVLAFIAMAQLSTMLVGGIDLSVGPFAGLVVVLASFLIPDGAGAGQIVFGAAVILVIGLLFGLLQGAIIEFFKLPSVVVTLATFIGLQGIALVLRPRPDGIISDDFGDWLGYTVLGVPVCMILALIAVVVLEWMLFRRPFGRALRAVGSNFEASYRLGVSRRLVILAAFTLAGGLTAMGGLIFATQIGIGSATSGSGDYTLTSITAVVLGGASVMGGRGSFFSTLMGAAMIQVTLSATAFFNGGAAWQYWLISSAALLAAVIFSLLRRQARNSEIASA